MIDQDPVLNDLERRAIKLARTAQQNSYAPYSNKRVGASVITSSGNIFAGCNVENASDDLGVCAERNAIGSAVMTGEKMFVTVVVIAPDERVWPPCRQCRPVLTEFVANPSVIMVTADGVVRRASLADLGDRPFAADDGQPSR